MLRMLQPFFFTRKICLFLVLSLLLLPFSWLNADENPASLSPCAIQNHKHLRILVVSTFHLTHKWTAEVNTTIEFGLNEYKPIIEYLDLNSVRGRTEYTDERFKAHLPLIQKGKYDLVIGLLHDAENLIIENIDSIPQNIPVILCGYQKVSRELIDAHPNITGLSIAFDIKGTLNNGLKIMPNTEEVLVITDDLPSGLKAHEEMLIFAKTFSKCKITPINGKDYSTWEMIEKVKSLGNKSFAIFTPWRNYDKDGFNSLSEIGELLNEFHVPYFVITDVLFEKGALGGMISHGNRVGKILIDLIRLTIQDGSAIDVPIRHDGCQFSLDMEIFRKLRLNKKLIPPETIRVNDIGAFWQQHPIYATGSIILITALSLIIVIVLTYHRRFRTVAHRNHQRQKRIINILKVHSDNGKIINNFLSNLSSNDSKITSVKEVLELLLNTLKCDRVYFGYYKASGQFKIETELLANGVPGIDIKDCKLLFEQLSQWHETFEKGNLIIIPEVQNSEYKEVFEKTGCKTFVCTPIHVKGHLIGVIGIGFISDKWQSAILDENSIHAISNIISLSFQRNEHLNELSSAVLEREMVFKEVQIPLLLFDNKGKIITFNDACKKIIDPKLIDEYLQHSCNELVCKEKDRPAWCTLNKILESKTSVSNQLRLNGRDYVIYASPIFDNEGNIRNIIKSAYDITESEETKKHLEMAIATEKALTHTKNEFLATISHTLRTPLNSIVGFSELLIDGKVSKEIEHEYLENIKNAGNSLLATVNDIIQVSKFETAQIRITKHKCNITEWLKSITALYTLQIEEKGLKLSLDIQKDIPQLILDPQHLGQAVTNLLGNAVKFTNSGSVSVAAKWISKGGNTGELILNICDTGVGIPKDALGKIFEPFYQIDVVRDAHILKGSGMGLPISMKLINAMGGTIEAKSEPCSGSVFTIRLKDTEVAPSESVSVSCKTANMPIGTNPTKKIKALLVDDIPLNLKVLTAMLKKIDVDTECATSGKEALELLSKTMPDIIFTDMWMPEMNGEELAHTIKSKPNLAGIPIVAVTADVEVNENFDTKKFNSILIKPVKSDQLKKVLYENIG